MKGLLLKENLKIMTIIVKTNAEMNIDSDDDNDDDSTSSTDSN
jgi:hypothetical protein